jgi:Domain of unknown function (DUF4331)
MSSHREAPEISKDPVADSTDTYAFVSPDRPNTVTLITNYIPLEDPAGGPNFFEFGDDVLYTINVDHTGDGYPDIKYEFRFETHIRNPKTFLYNTGQIESIKSKNLNRVQRFTVTEVRHGKRKVLGKDLLTPPCNIGPRSTPQYSKLANSAIHHLDHGRINVFAGQRLDPFYVDLGAVFDLATLRPFQNLHLISSAAAPGVDALRAFNVHTIAVQVPIEDLTRNHYRVTDPMSPNAVIGVWASASRRKGSIRQHGRLVQTGPFTQVSRLGNPLFNEVIVPMAEKDFWNSVGPSHESHFAKYVSHPELAALLPTLYPNVFPNLAKYKKPRTDLSAILLTGIPKGIIPGFQNFTGTTPADELRLNVAIPPSKSPNINGILGGDLAGFPNGRRVQDDIVTIELRAVAGATIPLVDPGFTPDGAATLVTDGVTPPGNVKYLAKFPYVGHPVSGYDVKPLSA